ncbi:MAG: FecR domain-containing protein [Bacteroidales bacterium]|nr:FecR domain-containing protein [Bacteroidales bacterium]
MDTNELHIDPLYLAGKYLSGEASQEEIRRLEDWVKLDRENEILFLRYRKVWNLTALAAQGKKIDTDTEWEKLRLKLFTESHGSPGIMRNLHSAGGYRLHRVAAVIVLLLSVSAILFFVLQKPAVKEFTSKEKVESIILEDGSEITLNSNTVITYSSIKSSKLRKVKLEGEAFFKVYPDATRPFVIETQGALVEVLGTSFLVSSRPDEPAIEVVVESGKVAFRSDSSSLSLDAGEKGIFDKTSGVMNLVANKDINAFSWKTGKLVFRDTPLAEVLSGISRAYGISIVLQTPAAGSCPLTATYENLTAEAILNVVAETLNLTVSWQGDTITVSGGACE